METIEHFSNILMEVGGANFLVVGIVVIVTWLLISGLRKGLRRRKENKESEEDDEENNGGLTTYFYLNTHGLQFRFDHKKSKYKKNLAIIELFW